MNFESFVRAVFSLVVRKFVRNLNFRLNNFAHLTGVRTIFKLVDLIGIEPTTSNMPC